MYKLSRAGISSAISTHEDKSYKADHTDPVSTSSCDSQAAVLWHKVGERDCVLSLIEFDMVPPSPINLRRSIDNALMSGSLFTAPPPSWTVPPAYSSFGWGPWILTLSLHL
ncbi:hypothetical protein WMY93_012403 [Mugilogobius chulae]|uniref:Uncharacterized protein n=1 Tax=Mugilogobius chulae TaxID=88201 RepID=A0AAW0PE65_9GOBI